MTRLEIGLMLTLILVVVFMRQCTPETRLPCPAGTETVRVDTFWKEKKDSTDRYRPTPTTASNKPSPPFIDSFIRYELPEGVAAILKDYRDSIDYSDTSMTDYGMLIIKDLVSRNRIQDRQVFTHFNIPEVTKTVTITAPAPKPRGQLYVGLNMQGTQKDILTAAGPSLMLKTKRDKVYEIGANYHKSGDIIYQAGMKFKISFRK